MNGIAGVPITITANTIAGGICETTTSETGFYSCITTLTDDQPFDAVIRVSGIGAPDTTIQVGAEEIPIHGGVGAKETNLAVSATTLHLSGKVRDPSGAPVAHARVQASSPVTGDGMRIVSATMADAQGDYQLYTHQLGRYRHRRWYSQ